MKRNMVSNGRENQNADHVRNKGDWSKRESGDKARKTRREGKRKKVGLERERIT